MANKKNKNQVNLVWIVVMLKISRNRVNQDQIIGGTKTLK